VNLASGAEDVVSCGIVVVQTGRTSVQGPIAALRDGGIAEVLVVGDCITPRRMNFAVLEGQRAGRAL
jgi:hypothetical protein